MNRNFLPLLIMFFILFSGCSSDTPSTQSVGYPVPQDDQTDNLPDKPQDEDKNRTTSVIPFAPGSTLTSVEGSYVFTEGPAVDENGDVYFSDIPEGKIYKWSTTGSVSVFMDELNGPNGLMFDKNGLLIACEGGNGRLISIDQQGRTSVVVDQYEGNRFNAPNDLWIDSEGGIYFTDPTYSSPVVQDGEHVYYLSPDRSQVTRVIDNMVRPNGIIGTPDGKTLYVTDHGGGQTFVYDIKSGGALHNGRLFVSFGADGMTLDANGNLYLTVSNQVKIFDASGNHLQDIPLQENPTNVAFGSVDRNTLFITARTAVYTIQMSADNPYP